MKIALINPQKTRMSRDPIRIGTPLGLLSLVSIVRKHLPKTEVHLIDASAEGKSEQEIKSGVYRAGLSGEELKVRLRNINADIVGISNIHTSEWENVAFCAEMAKEVLPDAKVIIGGHHATYEPDFMLRNTKADYIVMGEAEYPFIELVKAVGDGSLMENALPQINGIAFRSNNAILKTPKGKIALSLNELEDPAFDLLKPELYGPELSHWGKVRGRCNAILDFSISRGCPIGCSFCTSADMWGRRIRAFSPERVRQQIRKFSVLGFDNVSVEDDQVLLLRDESRNAMFEELGKQNINWVIDAGVYYPRITKEFVSHAADNGCYRVFLPIEHPVLDIMHNSNKYGNMKIQDDVKQKLSDVCRIFGECGVEFYVAIMVGFKQETKKTLKAVGEYARFMMDAGASLVNFFYPKPFPGTADYKNYSFVPEERRWENAPELWYLRTPVLKPDALEISELEAHVDNLSLEINGKPNTLVDSFAEKR